MTIPSLLTFRLIPSIFDFSAKFLAVFGFGDFLPADGLFLVSDPTTMNLTIPPLRSLLRATWGLEIIAVVAARSVVQTASIAKRVVSKNPVGIVNF